MTALQLNPLVLESAAQRIGKSLDAMAQWLSTSKKNQEKITKGQLSIPQAEKFARETRIPFGFLFLDSLPEQKKISIPDLRQTPNPENLSDHFFDTLEDIQIKQDWYIDYLKEVEAEQLPFVGQFSGCTDANIIAAHIRQTLGLPIDRTSIKTREAYFDALAERCESIGILVFRNGIVKNATKRSLSVSEFRGFVLADKYAPAIFINGKDAPAARAFTLAHELAHIWLGIEGVIDAVPTGYDATEVFCNKIAAEILVPSVEFLKQWQALKGDLNELSKLFYISHLAIARIALTHNKITLDEYGRFESAARNTAQLKAKNSSGGTFIDNIPIRNSRVLTKAVVNQAVEGKLLLRDAGKLLNISPQHIMDLSKKKSSL